MLEAGHSSLSHQDKALWEIRPAVRHTEASVLLCVDHQHSSNHGKAIEGEQAVSWSLEMEIWRKFQTFNVNMYETSLR